jgi:hypothetical protein
MSLDDCYQCIKYEHGLGGREEWMEKEHGSEDLTSMRRPCPRALP